MVPSSIAGTDICGTIESNVVIIIRRDIGTGKILCIYRMTFVLTCPISIHDRIASYDSPLYVLPDIVPAISKEPGLRKMDDFHFGFFVTHIDRPSAKNENRDLSTTLEMTSFGMLQWLSG